MHSVGGAPGGGGNYAAADRAHCRKPRRSRSQARDQFGVLHADHDEGRFDRDCDGLLADGALSLRPCGGSAADGRRAAFLAVHQQAEQDSLQRHAKVVRNGHAGHFRLTG